MEPGDYQAWYHTARGRWIAEHEFALLQRLMHAQPGATLLDVGCGTGPFSRRFVGTGLQVTGIDPDRAMLDVARKFDADVAYVQGTALALPFGDASFDQVAAMASLCFVPEPARALAELWRVTRYGVIVGTLNRHSLLHRRKRGRGAYAGARWDRLSDMRRWAGGLNPRPTRLRHGTAIFFPGGKCLARAAERMLPHAVGFGGFLAVYLEKDANGGSQQPTLR